MKRRSAVLLWLSCPFLFFLFSGCSSPSKPVDSCPSIQDEPVSVCRAQAKCRGQTGSIGVGVGVGLARGLGVGVGHRQSTDRYASCIDQDLKAQEKAREPGAQRQEESDEPSGSD